MGTKATASKAKASKTSAARPKPPARRNASTGVASPLSRPRHRVLVVQCDSNQLRRDQLALADTLVAAAKLFLAEKAGVDLVEGTTTTDLTAKLSVLRGRYTTIVVIGHSNEDVIRIGSDQAIQWPDFPDLVGRFKPKSVVIVGCKAGSMATASQFFYRLESVLDVYASPVNAKRVMLEALHFILPILAVAKRETAVGGWARAVNFIATGEALVRYTREEWEDLGDADVPFVELFDKAMPHLVTLAGEVKANLLK